MSQMIALGQTAHVNCAHCGRHPWQVSVLPGVQKLVCPACGHPTRIHFYVEHGYDGTVLFKMDVTPSVWL